MTEAPTRRVATPVELADCPEDGGKWAIYCEHDGETSVLQDTNKRRLAQWRTETLVWCAYCQEEAGQTCYGGYR
jgi:hypothetical protein